MLGPNPQADPATAIVYKLVAGVLTPDEAIAEIRDLVGHEPPAVLQMPEPTLALQIVEEVAR